MAPQAVALPALFNSNTNSTIEGKLPAATHTAGECLHTKGGSTAAATEELLHNTAHHHRSE